MTTIGVSTKAWQHGLYWALYSHAAIFDPSVGKVLVWECIRAHDSSIPGTGPPNPTYWRFIDRR
ncbi:hypothetical protein K438DRAFT_1595776 [Mycena galopus ATCC 62051]|nr:hypothetical protein K438DRAFT_1595776 [Mycena galopus ATCC 62051]